MRALILFLLMGTIASASQTYNCSYVNQKDFIATTTSALALSSNAMRRCLLIQNHNVGASNVVYVKFGSIHAGNEGFVIPGSSTVTEFINVPIQSMYMKSSNGGTAVVTILEGK